LIDRALIGTIALTEASSGAGPAVRDRTASF